MTVNSFVVTEDTLETLPTKELTDSHQAVFSHTAPITDEDMLVLDANPNKIWNVWFDALVLPSGFAKADITNFYGGNEGSNSAEFLQDLNVTRSALNKPYNQSYLPFSRTDVSVSSDGTDIIVTNTPSGGTDKQILFFYSYLMNTPSLTFEENEGLQICMLNIKITALPSDTKISIIPSVNLRLYDKDTNQWVTSYTPLEYDFKVGDNYIPYIPSWNTAHYVELTYSNGDAVGVLKIESISIEYGSNTEILNYLDSCRTVYNNDAFGATNLLMHQDASGRALDTTAFGYISVDDSGKGIDTNFKPNFSAYSIVESIEGDLQDFGAELQIAPRVSANYVDYSPNTTEDDRKVLSQKADLILDLD